MAFFIKIKKIYKFYKYKLTQIFSPVHVLYALKDQ